MRVGPALVTPGEPHLLRFALPCIWQLILNNFNDLVDIVSGINACSFNDLVDVTRRSTPHRSWWQHLTSRAVYKTIARRHQAFRNQYQIIYLGSSMSGKKNSAVGPDQVGPHLLPTIEPQQYYGANKRPHTTA